MQNESRLWQEWEQLEAEKLLFKEQQQTFEEERLKYLDAAKRLDREVHISIHEELCLFLLERNCVWSMQGELKGMPTPSQGELCDLHCKMNSGVFFAVAEE